MAFCSKCGSQIDENSKCPSCDLGVNENATPVPAPPGPAPGPAYTAQSNVFQKLNDTKDTTGEYDEKDINDNKLMAVLAYLGLLVFVPMFAAPNSKYVRFHTKQGFNLFLMYIGYSIINFLIRLFKVTRYVWTIPYKTTPGFLLFIGWLIGIPLFILSIVGIINAIQGRAKELPIIGKIQILK